MRAGARWRACALAGALALLALAAAPATASAGTASAGTASAGTASAGTASAGPASTEPSPAARQLIGGHQLASPGIVVNQPATGRRKLPRVPASAYVIADASTGQVLAAKDAHAEFGPASTLKVLTAVTLIPLLSPKAMVTASRQAADTEPNDVGLIAGHKYQVANLFRALLLISANDAAVALTQATGSLAKGMALINAEARHLQAYDVVAKQPNGLPARGQVVSAYDEALIAAQALRTPAFMKYDSTQAARFKVKRKKWVTLVNQNYLLNQYKGGIGGKIGWTDSSEATYIGLARRNGVTLIVTILHCRPLAEITSGEKLLNWGFAMAAHVKPVGVLVPPLTAATAARAAAPARAKGRRVAAARRPTSQAEARPSPDHVDAGLAVGAGVVAVGALGCGALARNRRRRAG